jgi:hypothetical protein
MDNRNSYIFLETQYLNLPIPQEILDERGSELTPLVTGQDEEGVDIIEPRTPQNTTIGSALEAYPRVKGTETYWWFNGTDVPTRLDNAEDIPTEMVDEVVTPKTDGKVFIIVGIPNFTFGESNAMKESMDALADPNTAAHLGVEVVNNSFHPWLSHKQMLNFTRNGVI